MILWILSITMAISLLVLFGVILLFFRRQGHSDQISRLNSQFEERARLTDDLFRKMLQDNH